MRRYAHIVLLALVAAAAPISARPTAVSAANEATPVAEADAPPLPPPVAVERPAEMAGSIDVAAPQGRTDSTPASPGRLDPRVESAAASGKVTVEVVLADGAGSVAAAVGGRSIGIVDGLELIEVDANGLSALSATPGVITVRQPVDLRRGLAATQVGAQVGAQPAARPQPGGGSFASNRPIDGTGVKIGIIDVFDTAVLTQQANQGILPVIPPAQRLCWYLGAPCTFGAPGYIHGNSVAEIARNYNNSTLFLAEVGTLTDYVYAINWFASNGVTIINHSATGPFDGPGNGTGPAASVVDLAVSRGMLWINAAGNSNPDPYYATFQGGYWRGGWSDPNNNQWLNWSGTDESQKVFCGALLGLRWSDWALNRTDYDLYISDTPTSTKVLVGGRNQTGASAAEPIEANKLDWLCNRDSRYGPVWDVNRDGYVNLWVKRVNIANVRVSGPSTGDVLEVMVNGGWFEYSTSAGSAGGPFADSANPGMVSVAAATAMGWPFGYSGRGPTNDGRVKPDLVATGCVSTLAHGSASDCYTGTGFSGTSASAPQIAAQAAIAQDMLGGATPEATAQYLRSIADFGVFPRVKSNDVGWGWARPWPAERLSSHAVGLVPLDPVRILDTRGVDGVERGAPIGLRPARSITRVQTAYWPGTVLMLSILLTDMTTPGYLQVYSTGRAAPTATSALNGRPNVAVANMVPVQVGAEGYIDFFNHAAGNIVADLVGVGVERNAYSRMRLIEAVEVHNTATCGGCGPVPGGTFIDVPVTGVSNPGDPTGGVPADDAEAGALLGVVLSLTVSGTAERGFASVTPTTTTTFSTSTLNYGPGQTVTGTAIVPVSLPDGAARIYLHRTGHVRVDVIGYLYYQSDATQIEGLFVSVPTWRAMDTRQTMSTPPGAGTSVVAGVVRAPERQTLPQGAWINVASTQGASGGTVIAAKPQSPAATSPWTSVSSAGQAMARGGPAQTDDDGGVRLSPSMSSHIVVDVSGFIVGEERTIDPAAVLGFEIGDQGGTQLSVSDDGSRVALSGYSTVVFDRSGNTIWTGPVGAGRLSGDGQKLLFRTDETMLPDDPLGTDTFLIDLSAGTVERITAPGLNQVAVAQMDDGASTVLIETDQQLLAADQDTVKDYYRMDLATGALTLASGAVPTDQWINSALLSDDGSMVVVATEVSLWYLRSGGSPVQVQPQARCSRLTTVIADGSAVLCYSSPLRLVSLVDGTVTEVLDEFRDFAPERVDASVTWMVSVDYRTRTFPIFGLDRDVVLWNTASGSGTVVSLAVTGAQTPPKPSLAAISDDGEWIVYFSVGTGTGSPAPGNELYFVRRSAVT